LAAVLSDQASSNPLFDAARLPCPRPRCGADAVKHERQETVY